MAERCVWCGFGYRDGQRPRKFCTALCRDRERRARRTNPCRVCGKTIPAALKICGPECVKVRERIKRRARNRANPRYKRRVYSPVCSVCGVPFDLSDLMRRVPRSVCYDCKKGRRRNLAGCPRLKRFIFARDAYRCWICLQPTDRATAWPDPRMPTLDHVVPVSAGGSDEPHNLRCACLRCNMQRNRRLSIYDPVQ